MFRVKDWLTQRTVAKYAPGIKTTLRSLDSKEWAEALTAFDHLRDLVDFERDRRLFKGNDS